MRDSDSQAPELTRLRRATSEQADGRNELAWLLVLDNLIDGGEAETRWLGHIGTRLARSCLARPQDAEPPSRRQSCGG